MIASRLTEQITINRRESISDGAGGYTAGTTTEVVSTLASVKHRSVSNDLIAQYGDLIEVYEFMIRYRTDIEIKSTDKIVWRGRTFEIIGLPPGFINRKQIKIIAKTSNKSTSDGL